MNTIFWLSVLGSFIGFGIFTMGSIGYWYIKRIANVNEKTLLDLSGGYMGMIQWRWLVLGAASLIISLTI